MKEQNHLSGIDVFTQPELRSKLLEFLAYYDLVSATTLPNKPPALKDEVLRKCRFCRRSFPNTTFKQVAHTFPELIGNKTLFSDDECDECNKKFGRYEDSFASFLGYSRTLFQVRGKKRIPNFNSPDGRLSAQTVYLKNELGIEISRKSKESNGIEFDESNGTLKLTSLKRPFRPFYVYLSLLKMGLSVIQHEETGNYSRAFNILNSGTIGKLWRNLAQVAICAVPYHYAKSQPILFRFRKKHRWFRVPQDVCIFECTNYIFQFPLPLHKNDDFFIWDKEERHMPICPPFAGNPFPEGMITERAIRDFSSDDVVSNEVDRLVLSGAPHAFNSIADVDLATGDFVDSELFSDIKSFTVTISQNLNSR